MKLLLDKPLYNGPQIHEAFVMWLKSYLPPTTVRREWKTFAKTLDIVSKNSKVKVSVTKGK